MDRRSLLNTPDLPDQGPKSNLASTLVSKMDRRSLLKTPDLPDQGPKSNLEFGGLQLDGITVF